MTQPTYPNQQDKNQQGKKTSEKRESPDVSRDPQKGKREDMETKHNPGFHQPQKQQTGQRNQSGRPAENDEHQQKTDDTKYRR